MINLLDLLNSRPNFSINQNLLLKNFILSGWIFFDEIPNYELILEIYFENKKLLEFRNNQYREELKKRVIHPTGICGFKVDLNNIHSKTKLKCDDLDIKIKNSNIFIKKSETKTLLHLKNVFKKYKLNNNRWVLKNVNFKVNKNDNLAIVGKNGQGKSTLLSLISGNDKPSKGEIIRNCTISWPIARAGGFQGSLTARENCIFVCKLFHGNSRIKTKKIISGIEDFADIGEYFDLPINTYSSGMKSRLSFALSLFFDFDIYLTDEIMAVGDINFKKKCQERIEALKKEKTFIMVTHSFNEILKNCNKLIILNNGDVKFYDDVKEGLDFYKRQTQ